MHFLQDVQTPTDLRSSDSSPSTSTSPSTRSTGSQFDFWCGYVDIGTPSSTMGEMQKFRCQNVWSLAKFSNNPATYVGSILIWYWKRTVNGTLFQAGAPKVLIIEPEIMKQ